MSKETEILGLVSIAYDKKYVLELENAIQLLKILAQSIYVSESYQEIYRKTEDIDLNVNLKLVSRQKIKEKILEQALEVNGNDS